MHVTETEIQKKIPCVFKAFDRKKVTQFRLAFTLLKSKTASLRRVSIYNYLVAAWGLTRAESIYHPNYKKITAAIRGQLWFSFQQMLPITQPPVHKEPNCSSQFNYPCNATEGIFIYINCGPYFCRRGFLSPKSVDRWQFPRSPVSPGQACSLSWFQEVLVSPGGSTQGKSEVCTEAWKESVHSQHRQPSQRSGTSRTSINVNERADGSGG